MWLSSQDLILREDDHMANNISMGAGKSQSGTMQIIDSVTTSFNFTQSSNNPITLRNLDFLTYGLTNPLCGMIVSGSVACSGNMSATSGTFTLYLESDIFNNIENNGRINLFYDYGTQSALPSFSGTIYTVILANKTQTDFNTETLNFYTFFTNLSTAEMRWDGSTYFFTIGASVNNYRTAFGMTGNLTFTTFYQSIS